MEFRILGTIEVVGADGRNLKLGGAKQRALLALLLVHDNEPVSSERLIDGLWGEIPPSTAATMLHGYISKLRRLLEPEGSGNDVLVTQPPGYLLRVAPGELDAERFELMLDEGTRELASGSFEQAAERLGEALSLWRGPALTDLASQPGLQTEIGRLEAMRLAAIGKRIEADLALGRHAELVPELEALVSEHPFEERLRGQLILALYRCGRQADALAAYQDARRVLVEELGIDPSLALQRLEQDILRQDVSLEPPAASAPGAVTPPSARGHRRNIALAAAVVLAAGLAIGAFELAGGRSGASVAASAGFIAVINPETNRVTRLPFPGDPSRIAIGSGDVWIADSDDGTLTRLSPELRQFERTFSLDAHPTDLAAGAGAIWLLDFEDDTLVRVNPGRDAVAARIRLHLRAPALTVNERAVAAGTNAVWVEDGGSHVTRIEARTGFVTDRIDVGPNIDAVAAGDGAVWVARRDPPMLVRLDARTRSVSARIPLAAPREGPAPYPLQVALGAGAVWALDDNTGTLIRVDPKLNAVVATVTDIAKAATQLAAGEGAVWIADSADASLIRVDPDTYKVAARIPLGGAAQRFAVGAGAVWVPVLHIR